MSKKTVEKRVHALICADKTRTQQSHKKECDINTIMENYLRTGVITHRQSETPLYGDFSNVPAYNDAFDIYTRAQAQFKSLPAPLRSRFDNDPAKFLAYCEDPKNIPEMTELGLLGKPKPIPQTPEALAAAAAAAQAQAPHDNAKKNPPKKEDK